jgi:hypothetical protein
MYLLGQRQLWSRSGRQSDLGKGANGSRGNFELDLRPQGTMSDSDGEIGEEKKGGTVMASSSNHGRWSWAD